MKPLATIMVTLIAPSVLQVSGIVGEPAGWGQSRPDSVVLQTITGEVSSVVGEFHMAKIPTAATPLRFSTGPIS